MNEHPKILPRDRTSWVRGTNGALFCVWHGRGQSQCPPTATQSAGQFHPADESATLIQSAWRGYTSRQRLIKRFLFENDFHGLAEKWGLDLGSPTARRKEAATKIQAVRRGKSVRMSFDAAGIAGHPGVETYTDMSGHWQKCNPKDWVVSSGIVDGRLWWDPLKKEVWYLIGSDVIVPCMGKAEL